MGRTATPGIYTIYVSVKPDCPERGYARVRIESGRVYPWRTLTPTQGTVFRGVPWYHRLSWQAQSGKAWPVVLKIPAPRWGGL